MEIPKVSIVLSTLGRRPEEMEKLLSDLTKQTDMRFELLVVCQYGRKSVAERCRLLLEEKKRHVCVKFVKSKSSGLLKSRNLGLMHARGDYVLFADDDCRYAETVVADVVATMRDFSAWDVVTFLVADEFNTPLNGPLKRPGLHNSRTIMKVYSVGVVLRRNILLEEGTRLFDERFGLGTSFPTGGENILMSDLLKKKYVVGFVPRVVAVHSKVSSGTGGKSPDLIAYAKGAMFRRMFGMSGSVLALAFLIKKCVSRNNPGFRLAHVRDLFKGFRDCPGVL